MAYFAKATGLYTIGFSISALSLIFALNDPAFPATHHTTLVAGYAIAQTGNILIAVAFGVIAYCIDLLFGMVFNTDCGTHVDPPAVALRYVVWFYLHYSNKTAREISGFLCNENYK